MILLCQSIKITKEETFFTAEIYLQPPTIQPPHLTKGTNPSGLFLQQKLWKLTIHKHIFRLIPLFNKLLNYKNI